MGKSLLHRQGEMKRKMYLLLILLITPALGRPSSAQADVVNKLQTVNEYTKGMSQLMKNSRLLGTVDAHLQEAKQNIREMDAELRSLQSEIRGLRNTDNYFPEFEEALEYIRQARKDLAKLAKTTEIEANKLLTWLEILDSVEDSAILTKFIASLKSLMLETKKKLEDARGKYNSAHQAFDNLIRSVATQNGILDQTVKQMNAQYQGDKTYTESVRYWCKWAAIPTLGFCSLIHHFANEVPLEEDRVKLVNLKSKSDEILGKTRILNRDIEDAIEVITVEVELITKWAVSAEVVSQNIVQFPEESLRKFKGTRIVFKNGLNALRIDAKNFVDLILDV